MWNWQWIWSLSLIIPRYPLLSLSPYLSLSPILYLPPSPFLGISTHLTLTHILWSILPYSIHNGTYSHGCVLILFSSTYGLHGSRTSLPSETVMYNQVRKLKRDIIPEYFIHFTYFYVLFFLCAVKDALSVSHNYLLIN